MTSFPRTHRTRSAPTDRATDGSTDMLLSARWRVGLRGHMSLMIQPGVAELTLTKDPESVDAGANWTRSLVCTFAESRDERLVTLTSAADGLCVTLALPNGVDGSTLLITDLPERIGLRGGTYVLEQLTLAP